MSTNDLQSDNTAGITLVYENDRQPSQHEVEKAWRFMCRLLSGDFYRVEIEIAAGKKDELHIKGMKRAT